MTRFWCDITSKSGAADLTSLNRRELITALLGWNVALAAGCTRRSLPPDGELLRTSFRAGHAIRDRKLTPSPSSLEDVTVVIVGGGIAGLSAAWRFLESGFDDFVLLDLEDEPGGTARGGSRGGFAYPWGAHYVPVPMAENESFIRLLQQMNVIIGLDDEGAPIVGEEFLCRDPHERLFHDGQWHEGIYPFEGASEEDLRQLEEFQSEINRWVDARDSAGRRMFAIPISRGSDDPEVTALDQFSMATWMDQHGWHSERLRWLVDYSCRDDYGLSIGAVSAWAGMFYFASRVRAAGEDPQSVITWPEGNGRIANHLARRAGEKLRCGVAVAEISQRDRGASVIGVKTINSEPIGFHAEQVVFAAPQFLTPHVIRKFDASNKRDTSAFTYGSWLVANVHVRDRPRENGFPMCWDNVIFGSKSLGYVTATHQSGLDHGPTVLTWYYPFADTQPKVTRKQMLELQWSDWAEVVMADLRTAHDDIDALVTRIDIMCWGHAMIQPRPGFVWSRSRHDASKPYGPIHFAGTDLSGVALVEEAFDHGVRAAEEVLQKRGVGGDSIL